MYLFEFILRDFITGISWCARTYIRTRNYPQFQHLIHIETSQIQIYIRTTNSPYPKHLYIGKYNRLKYVVLTEISRNDLFIRLQGVIKLALRFNAINPFCLQKSQKQFQSCVHLLKFIAVYFLNKKFLCNVFPFFPVLQWITCTIINI